MPTIGRRSLIVAIAVMLAAGTIGVITAMLVLPADRPEPAPTPAQAAIRIDPVAVLGPNLSIPPAESTPRKSEAKPRRLMALPKSADTSEPAPVTTTVTITNSW